MIDSSGSLRSTMRRRYGALASATLILLLLAGTLTTGAARADDRGIYRGVQKAVKFDISPALRSFAPIVPGTAGVQREIVDDLGEPKGPVGPQDIDPLVQSTVGPGQIPDPVVSFDGPPNIFGVSPPDPNGDVGPNHFVAMSNLSYAVYDKSGTLLAGPFANNTLWTGFGGDCETDNSGDPVVLYDQFADRWLLT